MKFDPDNIPKLIGLISLGILVLVVAPCVIWLGVTKADCDKYKIAAAQELHLMSCSDAEIWFKKRESERSASTHPLK